MYDITLAACFRICVYRLVSFLCFYMFRHHCVIIREISFITLSKYISTIVVLVKINKKSLKL
jgi:hypothetical protein